MKLLWERINDKGWKKSIKMHSFISISCIVGSVVGWIIWYLIHFVLFNTIEWMMVFIGYPFVFIWIKAVFYLYNHEFQ